MTAVIVIAAVVLAISATVGVGSLVEPYLGRVWLFLGIGDDTP